MPSGSILVNKELEKKPDSGDGADIVLISQAQILGKPRSTGGFFLTSLRIRAISERHVLDRDLSEFLKEGRPSHRELSDFQCTKS